MGTQKCSLVAHLEIPSGGAHVLGHQIRRQTGGFCWVALAASLIHDWIAWLLMLAAPLDAEDGFGDDGFG